MKNIFLFLVCIIFNISCNSKNASTKPKVAIVISTLNNPWFVDLANIAAKNVQDLGYEAKIFDAQNNTSLESDIFENLISSGFNAILFNPTDADGSIVNIQKAKTAGIPVFCMDREVNSNDAATSQILSDSYSGCVDIGMAFVKELPAQAEYVELLGLVSDNNTHSRSGGFHSVVDKFTGLKMVAQQSADFDRAKALEVMESMIQAHPDFKGVFCGNDAMAMGAYQAIVSAAKQKQIKVFGFDGAPDVVAKISTGDLIATGMQHPEIMAQTAAKFADDFFKGKRDFPQRIPVEVEMVEKSNAKLFMKP